jgi:L-amino acid N-acyltransferase YncA
MDQLIFQEARIDDLAILADILNYYIEHTTVSFHTKPVTIEEMSTKIFFDQPRFKTFVIRDMDLIIGYCGLSPWKKQEAYAHTGEISVYLAHDFTGKGIGSVAIKYLVTNAKGNDINNLIAGICSENIPSIKAFEKAGFEQCAHFEKVGKKFDRVLDTVYLQLIL